MPQDKIQELTEKIIEFSRKRHWGRGQTPKNLALSVVLEAAELLEHFQWKDGQEISAYVRKHKKEIGVEVADVAVYLFHLTHKLGLDLAEIVEEKLRKNAIKYPVKRNTSK